MYFVGIDHRVVTETAGYYPAFPPGARSLPGSRVGYDAYDINEL